MNNLPIKKITQEILKDIDAKLIYLFGSFAKGEARDDSDVVFPKSRLVFPKSRHRFPNFS
ncbi:nucleotidyltransferase domain-containing protein [Camelliibacillus cellulosilyticus]|uniref:Nucleotidyltransferase domain-containing protein n=1 Tax=Camelliibacillus cellulosilyticus TaxID=2174486 RepID=A0ABV9GR29_9BACL